MPLTFDDDSNSGNISSTTTFSWTHVPVGTPTGVGFSCGTVRATAGPTTVSSITYGGNAASFEDARNTGSNRLRVELWSLASPPSGSQAVTVSFNEAGSGAVTAVTVTDGDTADVFDGAPTAANASSTTPSVSVTTTVGDVVLDAVVYRPSGAYTISADSPQVSLYAAIPGPGSRFVGASYKDADATSETMSWTGSQSVEWGIIAAPFKQGAAGDTALAGDAAATVAATGALTTAIQLAAAAIAQVSATGALSTEIRLQAAAMAEGTASGALSTEVRLQAGAAAQVSASGDLSTGISLAAQAAAQAAASGALSTEIRLAAAALAQVSATGALDAAAALAGAALAQVSASGALSTEIRLQAAALAQVVATGTLDAGFTASPANRTLRMKAQMGRTLAMPREVRALAHRIENRTLRMPAHGH